MSNSQSKFLTHVFAGRSARVFAAGASFGLALVVAGCSSGTSEPASQMTSYSATESKAGTPQLFTIPDDQMSHVQVVSIESTKITRTLRLTGAVAYNAFK